jgi:hypothetical protein
MRPQIKQRAGLTIKKGGCFVVVAPGFVFAEKMAEKTDEKGL